MGRNGPAPVSQSHRYHPAVCRCPSPGRLQAPPPWGCGERWLVWRLFQAPVLRSDLFPPFSPHLPVGPLTPSAEALQAAPRPQSAGAVVIVAILSVLLAVVLTTLVTLLIYTW